MTTRWNRISGCVCLLLFVCAGDLMRAAAKEEATPATMAEAVDAYIQPLVDTGLFSGSILLARDGKVLVHRAFGHADIDKRVRNSTTTRHKIMSTTKSITAVVIMRLVQSGKLGLNDLVSKHLAGWPAGWNGVLVKHLLDHTSGLPNLENAWAMTARQGKNRGLALWKQIAPLWADQKLVTRVGTQHRYSNLNYELLGAIAEVICKLDYADVVRAQIFEPAGMKESGFDDGSDSPGLALGYFRGKTGKPEPRGQDMSVILAAGGIYSTTGDLYRFDRALTDDTLLTAASRKRMMTAAPHTYGYALGWKMFPVQEHACARHSGGANGYVADLLRFPEDNACIVLLSNFAFAPSLLIADGLAACLFGRDGDKPARVKPKVLDRYRGAYRGPESTVVIRRSDACLAMYELKEGQDRIVPTLLLALGEDRFRRQSWPSRMRFEMKKHVPTRLYMAGNQTLEFAPVEAAKVWKKAVGRYQTKAGIDYHIAYAKNAFYMRQPDGRSGDLEIIPATEDSALTLYGEDFATPLTLKRDVKGVVRSFHWKRNDGRTIECIRQ